MARRSFPTTRWSIIAGAQASGDERESALAALCQAYWQPVNAYIQRRGFAADEAADLTQEFFTAILEERLFDRARQHRGSFRGFLLAALKFFLADIAIRESALKRGNKLPHVSIEPGNEGAAAPEWETPERIYERRWALTLIERVMTNLSESYETLGKRRQCDLCKPFLVGDHFPGSLDRVAGELRMSHGALKVAVYRMRKRYAELFRAEVAELVATPEQVDEEIRYLIDVLRYRSVELP